MNRRTEFYIPEIGKSQPVDQGGKGDFSIPTVRKGSASKTLKSDGKYVVIVGSFTDRPNADKIIDQLKKEGYQVEIITGVKTFKAGVDFKNLQSAQEGLAKLKAKYPGAWIL